MQKQHHLVFIVINVVVYDHCILVLSLLYSLNGRFILFGPFFACLPACGHPPAALQPPPMLRSPFREQQQSFVLHLLPFPFGVIRTAYACNGSRIAPETGML